ncbi:unnamed protein product [Closterium sp. Yama58-4]|nr:unnamed protein product [Closterium sp. Yama58-4]
MATASASRGFMAILAIISLVFAGSCAAIVNASPLATVEAAKTLAVPAEDGSYGSLKETFQAVKLLSVVSKSSLDSAKLCAWLKKLPAATSAEEAFQKVSIAAALGCKGASAVVKEAEPLFSTAASSSSLDQLFYAAAGIQILKANKWSTGSVPSGLKKAAAAILALKQADGTWATGKDGQGSVAAAGVALEALAALKELGLVDEKQVSAVTDAVGSLFSLLTTDSDPSGNAVSFFSASPAEGGALVATASAITGYLALASTLASPLAVRPPKVAEAGRYLVAALPLSLAEAAAWAEALAVLDNNPIFVPIFLSSPGHISISADPTLTVSVTTALGGKVPGVAVKLQSATIGGGSAASGKELATGKDGISFSAKPFSKASTLGVYTLKFKITPPAESAFIVGSASVERPLLLSAAMAVTQSPVPASLLPTLLLLLLLRFPRSQITPPAESAFIVGSVSVERPLLLSAAMAVTQSPVPASLLPTLLLLLLLRFPRSQITPPAESAFIVGSVSVERPLLLSAAMAVTQSPVPASLLPTLLLLLLLRFPRSQITPPAESAFIVGSASVERPLLLSAAMAVTQSPRFSGAPTAALRGHGSHSITYACFSPSHPPSPTALALSSLPDHPPCGIRLHCRQRFSGAPTAALRGHGSHSITCACFSPSHPPSPTALALSSLPDHPPAESAFIVGSASVERPLLLSASMAVTGMSVAVLDSDGATPEAEKKLDFEKRTNFTDLSATHLQKLRVSLSLSTPSGKAFVPHQAVLQLVNSIGMAYSFLLKQSGSTLSVQLELLELMERLFYHSGEYTLKLIIGDQVMDNAFDWQLGSVDLDLPVAPETAPKLPARPESLAERFAAKPEIAHIFRKPDPRPAFVVSYSFVALVLLPLVVLLVGLAVLGVNLKAFPSAGVPLLSALAFHGGIAALLLLYVAFWVQVNLFTTLKLILLLAVLTAIPGHQVLSYLADVAPKAKTE